MIICIEINRSVSFFFSFDLLYITIPMHEFLVICGFCLLLFLIVSNNTKPCMHMYIIMYELFVLLEVNILLNIFVGDQQIRLHYLHLGSVILLQVELYHLIGTWTWWTLIQSHPSAQVLDLHILLHHQQVLNRVRGFIIWTLLRKMLM